LVAVVAGGRLIGAAVSLARGGTAPIYWNTGHTCDTGATDTTDQVGHVNARVSQHTISGVVDLTAVARNSNFTIVLVQDAPCVSQTVGTLTTDGQGNGSLKFTATAEPGASVAWVSTSHNTHHLASTTIPLP
jgi:hypothetical protein